MNLTEMNSRLSIKPSTFLRLNTCDLSSSGYIECVKWLIANRAKVDVLDNNGRTPLDIAEVK